MTRTTRPRTAALLALGMASAFALAGCAAPSTGVIAPVIADLTKIDGTTVTVGVGNVIDLTGDDQTYTSWEADIADPKIVEFTPGKDDGSAQFNPGLKALAEGSTEVTLDNSESGDSVTFTVEVTPAP